MFGDGKFGFVKQVFDKGSEVQGSAGMLASGSDSENGGNIDAVGTNQNQKCWLRMFNRFEQGALFSL